MWFGRSAKLDLQRDSHGDQHGGTGSTNGKPGRPHLRVAVPNAFVADWIGKHFDHDLRQAACAALCEELEDIDMNGTGGGGEAGGNIHTDPQSINQPSNTATFTTAFAEHDIDLEVCIDPTQFETAPLAPGQTPATDNSNPNAAPTANTIARSNTANQQTAPAKKQHVLRHRLDDFIIGPSNELAYAAATQIITPRPTFPPHAPHAPQSLEAGIHQSHNNPTPNSSEEIQRESGGGTVFIHGACGLGKTHLLQGLCQRFREMHPGAQIMYATAEHFTNMFLAAVRTSKIDEFRRRIRRLDLLAIDDVHFFANKSATQQEFLHSFDAIGMSGSRLALASDSHPKQIKLFSEALISRCVSGMVVQIHSPDHATRCQIIRELARRRRMSLLDSVVDTLASRCCGSIRELEGAITKLSALASLNAISSTTATATATAANEPIGHALLNRLLESDFDPMPRHMIRFDTILDKVSQKLLVPRAQIVGSARQRQVVLARSMTIHLTRQLTTMSYPEIAAAMGRSNHSTIITSDRRIEQQTKRGEIVNLPNEHRPMPMTELIAQLKREISAA